MRFAEKVTRFQTARKVMEAGIYPYFRAIQSDQDTVVNIDGKPILMLGSNNYLGLTNHPKVKEAAIQAIRQYGTGCAGSRFLNGTLSIHIECEERLAEFMNKEAVLLFSTGFQANLGSISSLIGRNGFMITDSLDHASIIDGARLAFGKMVKFAHNDMEDLERVLKSLENKTKAVITEGVFSMEGDTVKLPEIVELCKKYNADLILDDAHGVGVLGQTGAGTAEHFHLTDKCELIVGTFSKSLASIGGFVASTAEIIHFLKHHSRALIFSASPPPASVAAVIEAIKIIKAEPERRELLWRNTDYLRKGLQDIGLDTGTSNTPIIPVLVGDQMNAFLICHMMQEEGIFINPVVAPAVQPWQSLIRFSVMSTHTLEQLDFALDKISKLASQFHLKEIAHSTHIATDTDLEGSDEFSTLSMESSSKRSQLGTSSSD